MSAISIRVAYKVDGGHVLVVKSPLNSPREFGGDVYKRSGVMMKYLVAAALLFTYGGAVAADILTPNTVEAKGHTYMASQLSVKALEKLS